MRSRPKRAGGLPRDCSLLQVGDPGRFFRCPRADARHGGAPPLRRRVGQRPRRAPEVRQGAGHEIERRMLQAHLDLRAARERPVDVRGADGVRRTTRRESSRMLLTIVGEVEVKRWEYEAKGVRALHPADAALNLPPGRYSFGVRRLVVEEACRGSFDEVVEQTKKIIGVAVPKRQIEELTVRAAQDFTAFYATRAVEAEDTIALLVFGFDAKGVVMRHEDLREATKKAAVRSQRRLQTRLTRGEKRNRKRMAQVATIYTIDPWVRTPMDILHEFGPV